MDTKTKINNTYSETLLAMENNDSINDCLLYTSPSPRD